MTDLDDLKKLYNDWANNKLIFENVNDHIEITTPFVDMHHDYIQLYLSKEQHDKYKITDDGHIVTELEMLGIDILNTKKRKEFFNSTLKIFGIMFDETTYELYVNLKNLTDYPEKQHKLIQCMLRISDILLTSRNTVISIFTEEISNFFEENGIVFIEGSGFTGVSGNTQNFDFVLPRFKNSNEKLVKAINSPSPDNYIQALWPWIDIKDVRKNAELLVLANDTNKPIPDKFYNSLTNYSVEILEWSKRKEWIDKLKIV